MPTASKTASKFPRFHLTYAGRKWRIFKRAGSPCWYLVFQKDGKRHLHSLGDTTKETASEAAKVKIRAWKDGRLDVLRRSMERPGDKQFARLADVLASVETMISDASASTRHNYAMSLRWILRKVHPTRDPDTLTTAVFGDDTARQFWLWAKSAAVGLDQKALRRHAGNCHSIFTMAGAIVSPKNLAALAPHHFPDVKPFRDSAKQYGFGKIASDRGAERPDWPVLRRTLVEWVRMGRTPGYTFPGANRKEFDDTARLNAFRVVGLVLSFGLRKGELAQARAEWLTRDEHGPVLRAGMDAAVVNVKNKSGEINVTPLDPFFTILRRHGKLPASGYLLTGEFDSDREYWPFYHVGKWLRAMGWTTQKTNHALRDLSASLIITKFGVDKAKWWARHSSVVTTEAHYSRFVDQRAALTQAKVLPWLRFATK